MSSELTAGLGLFKAVPGTGEPFRTTDLNDNADLIDAAVVADRERLDVIEANGWVHEFRIADGAVTPNKIPNNSITVDKLAVDSVAALQLQPNSVGTSELQSGSVTDAKVASGLSASKLTTGALDPARIPDGSLGGYKLSNSLNLLGKNITVPDNYDVQAAASVNVATVVAASAVSGLSSSVRLPFKMAAGQVTATPSSGIITVDVSSYGFSNEVGALTPAITAIISSPSTSKFVVGLNSITTVGTAVTAISFKVLTSAGANATVSTQLHWQMVQY